MNKGGFCRDPELCADLRARHQRVMDSVLPFAIEQHEEFLRYPWHSIVATRHATQRILERGYSFQEVRDVIECTEPIEWGEMSPIDLMEGPDQEDGTYLVYHVLFKGETEEERPMHVVCRYGPRPHEGKRWLMKIMTVYDPSDRSFRWAKEYTVRVCFCAPEDMERLHEEAR